MFNNNKGNETDFCESYKSEVLGTSSAEQKTSLISTILKLLTILILLAIIIGVSFYGYNYFMKKQKTENISLPPVSVQVSDDDVLTDKELEADSTEEQASLKSALPPIVKQSEANQLEIEKIANDVKMAISKSGNANKVSAEEVEKLVTEQVNVEKNTTVEVNDNKSLELPTLAPEAQYLEELADLSKEIDKERKK